MSALVLDMGPKKGGRPKAPGPSSLKPFFQTWVPNLNSRGLRNIGPKIGMISLFQDPKKAHYMYKYIYIYRYVDVYVYTHTYVYQSWLQIPSFPGPSGRRAWAAARRSRRREQSLGGNGEFWEF